MAIVNICSTPVAVLAWKMTNSHKVLVSKVFFYSYALPVMHVVLNIRNSTLGDLVSFPTVEEW